MRNRIIMRNKNSWTTVCCISLNDDTPLRSSKQILFEFFKVSPSRVRENSVLRLYSYTDVPCKVARYVFSGPIPPKFEHKLRRHKQSFGKIATTVVLDEDGNLLWSGLQRHRSCHSNEMTLLAILLAAVYLGTRDCSSKIIRESFFLQ